MVTRDGNNEGSFQQFIDEHLLSFPIDKTNSLVVLDLATYHGGHMVMSSILEEGISVIFLPPSSSNLNPIEKLWSILKSNLAKRRAMYSANNPEKIMSYNMLTETEQSFQELRFGTPK